MFGNYELDGKKHHHHIIGVFVVLLLASLIVWVNVDMSNKVKERGYIGQEISSKNTISVSGVGEIYAKPDLAVTNFSVVTEGARVVDSMTENTKKMNRIIGVLKSLGVEEKDLKTVGFNVYPRYEWHNREVGGFYQQGERVLVGYEVNQSLQVKIRDMEKIGEIIESATGAGATNVGGLQFTIDDEEGLKKDAREQAIVKAKDKAKELASQLGVSLVRITSFNESGVSPRYYGLEKTFMADSEMGVGGGVAQIETGENKIEVNVNIVYEIK